jgi:hypothetical protein
VVGEVWACVGDLVLMGVAAGLAEEALQLVEE